MKKAWAGFSKQGIGSWLLGFAALIILGTLLHAQTATVSPPTDSIVQVTAEAQGLDLIAPTDLPNGGTFWLVTSNGITAPSPCPPNNLSDFPVYAMADGIYLVDETGGQVVTNEENSTIESALAAQADAVTALINQVQDAQLNQDMAMAFGLDMEMDSSASFSPMFAVSDPTALWLEITNVSNGWSYLNLHKGTNFVYAILSKTNLTDATWNIETELFPTGDQTNVMPFAVQNLDRQTLFLKAMDWTGVDSDSDGIPDWWAWQYWGGINVTDTNLDYSNNGQSFSQEYSNSTPPTVFSITGLALTNNYVSTMSVPVQLDVAGSPYYVATLVDDPNFSNAVWNTYSSSSLTVNLGLTEGWHDVWVGLRGHADDANSAVWQWRRLKLDFTPPTLVITSPTNPTVNVPVIQLTGFSPESLTSISYDLSNAAGTVTNQPVLVEGQDYSTNTMEFTTNYFQAYDVPLTNGVNVLTLHATDLAGNLTTLTTNINYVTTTNPPAVNLVWPQDGMQISGSNLTIQGQVDDPTATATVAVVDANGNTNTFNGLTGRDGNFWIENVPLNAGTNLLMVTVTNAAGVSTTTLNLYQSSVNLTFNAVAAGDTNVTCSIDTDGYTVWVNGNEATDNGDGTWTAQITPIGIGGGLVIAEAVPDGNNFSSNRRLAGRFQSMQDSNPDPDIYAGNAVQPPQGVFVSAYHATNSVTAYGEDDYYTNYNSTDWVNGQGGNSIAGMTGNGYILWQDESAWPSNTWPQPLPEGTMEIYGEDGNTNVIGPIGLPEEHCDINKIIDGNGTVDRRTADTEMKLATGGPLGSTQQNLWCISATATDAETGLPIPPEQISIGDLGNLDADGNLWIMLPDNDPPVVTPMIAGIMNYIFSKPTATKYPPAIVVNNAVTLDSDSVTTSANFCVGQSLTFDVTGLPGTVYNLTAIWTLPEKYVNTNSDPNCDLFYEVNTNLLKPPQGTSATHCWYVKDGQPLTASVHVYYRCTQNGCIFDKIITGMFNVHRPTTAQATPYQPDGTPTAEITNITYGILWGNTINATRLSLSLGDGNQHNDMNFSNTITADNFSAGQAGYVQLITGGSASYYPYSKSFGAIGLDGALGEFARGTPSVPANATTGVSFYDGPCVPLATSDDTTSEDVSFSTYLMFKPNSSGSIWVPLRLITWQLNDEATFDTGSWNPHTGTTTTTPPGNDSTDLPHWTTTY